jgi:hypothetical protein
MFLHIRSFMGFIGAQLFIPKDFIESFIYDLNPPKFLCTILYSKWLQRKFETWFESSEILKLFPALSRYSFFVLYLVPRPPKYWSTPETQALPTVILRKHPENQTTEQTIWSLWLVGIRKIKAACWARPPFTEHEQENKEQVFWTAAARHHSSLQWLSSETCNRTRTRE